jgi:Saxitoxin biosynthesis operon protein SxtJ
MTTKSAQPPIKLPSDKSFGWTFTGIFVILGLFLHPLAFALAVATASATLINPGWLAPFNRAWMKFGMALHHVISPVVMGLMFFAVFTPMGVVMRMFGWDAMKRAWDPALKSYWVRRDPPGPAEDSFKDLF